MDEFCFNGCCFRLAAFGLFGKSLMSDSPPNWWYEPLEWHEIDCCTWCHDEGYHADSIDQWSKWGCWDCEEKQRR